MRRAPRDVMVVISLSLGIYPTEWTVIGRPLTAEEKLLNEIEARSYCPHSRLTKHYEGNDPTFACWRAPYPDEICPAALGGCGQYVNTVMVDGKFVDEWTWLYVDGCHWHSACHSRRGGVQLPAGQAGA